MNSLGIRLMIIEEKTVTLKKEDCTQILSLELTAAPSSECQRELPEGPKKLFGN